MKEVKSRKRVYGFIAVALIICLSLAVFLALELSANAPTQAAESLNASENDANPPNASTPEATLQNNSSITEDEATRIAMPFIEQNAKENNRMIAKVNATFYDKTNHRPRPAWEIRARYLDVKDIDSPQHWIVGYCVLVWADTGEIRSVSEDGIM